MTIVIVFFGRKKEEEKKAIFLIFQYQEDAIRPELSSSARLRVQGGYPEPDRGVRMTNGNPRV